MNRRQLVDALEFENQHSVDKKVNAVAAIQMNALVLNWLRMLKLKPNPVLREFVSKALVLRGFK